MRGSTVTLPAVVASAAARAHMLRYSTLLLLSLAWPLPSAMAQDASAPAFSAEEVQRIRALGPWPPILKPDPSNRVSGKIQAIELGRRLFRDARMSPVGYIACVTCHQPDRSFTDLKARAHGLADLPRNTPALANLRQQHWFGWGGSNDSLWMASIRPMLDAREFDGSPATVRRLFERDPELAACYRKVFRESPRHNPERTVVNVGKALAAFEETLVTGRTPFDDFRDALARNDSTTISAYPAAARRGLKLFVGRAGCADCHAGANFSDGEFHSGMGTGSGTMPISAALNATSSAGDSGRLESARSLQASPLNLLGRYNDDRARATATATRKLVVNDGMRGEFRTPSLRNVTVTAPYMHNGKFDRLQDAVQHMSQPVAASPEAWLSAQQVNDLTAFLATLTDRYGERRPWSAEQLARCP